MSDFTWGDLPTWGSLQYWGGNPPEEILAPMVVNGMELLRSDGYTVMLGADPWVGPDVDADDQALPQSWGVFPSAAQFGARRVEFKVTIDRPDRSQARYARQRLCAAVAPSTVPSSMHWLEDGQRWIMFGRFRGGAPDTTNEGQGHSEVTIRFVATDPRIYLYDVQAVAGAPMVAPSVAIPLAAPVVFGAPTLGDIYVDNQGEVPAVWQITIPGPVVDPSFQNTVTGQTLSVIGTVESGEMLTIDSNTRSVSIDGDDRMRWLRHPARWWDLPPGTTRLRYRTAAGSSFARVAWRHAYI